MRLAILDDYQGVAHELGGWEAVDGLEIVAFRDHVHDPDQLVARLQGFQAVMRIRERTEFPREVLERLPDLRLILATGMRNGRSIDLKAAEELGITVCATDAHHQVTVELTLALILNLTRNLPAETASVRAGGWQVAIGDSLNVRTLGIVGLGNMGIPVARIAGIMGMEVLAWSPRMTPERAAEHGAQAVTLDELMSRSHVITVHMPLADGTVGLIGEREIGLMRRDAVIVNTSRPQIVDERALIAALASGAIAGAGLDVFEVEPLPVGHPFRTLPNVVATPHIGFVTRANMTTFYRESRENLVAFLAGSPVRTIAPDRPYLEDSGVAHEMHVKG